MSASLPANSDISALYSLLGSSLSDLAKIYESKSVPLPSVKDASPFNPTLGKDPGVKLASTTALAACYQLIASLEAPPMFLMIKAGGFHVSSALRIALNAHVAEALRGAGTQGLHVNEIAKWSVVDPQKLSRVLRLLAANHIFTEQSSDVFANNGLSTMLDTKKSKEELTPEKEKEWYLNTNGLAAGLAHTTDEVFKCSAYLPETLFDPAVAHSYASDQTALQKAFNTEKGAWEFWKADEIRGPRFDVAMVGSQMFQDPKALARMYDWSSLPKDSIFVDVGGGMGQQALTLLKEFPHLKAVVQDQEQVVVNGKQFWQEKHPEALASNRVTFAAHDFFKPQPVKGAEIYFLKAILHDWPNSDAIAILSNLRAACSTNSRVVVVDSVVPYLFSPDSAPGSNSESQKMPNSSSSPVAPPPLLPQFGQAGAFPYFADMQMLVGLNGQERTLGTWEEITKKAGFQIERLTGNLAAPFGGALVFVPA